MSREPKSRGPSDPKTTASRQTGSWYVRVTQSYPHHESLRGEVGLLKRVYDDGNVLVLFENGDRVCMDRRYVEDLS